MRKRHYYVSPTGHDWTYLVHNPTIAHHARYHEYHLGDFYSYLHTVLEKVSPEIENLRKEDILKEDKYLQAKTNQEYYEEVSTIDLVNMRARRKDINRDLQKTRH